MPIFSEQDLIKIKGSVSPQTIQLKPFEIGVKADGKPKDLATPQLQLEILGIEDKETGRSIINHINKEIISTITIKITNKGQTLATDVQLVLYFLGQVRHSNPPVNAGPIQVIKKEKIGVLLAGETITTNIQRTGWSPSVFFISYAIVAFDIISDPFNHKLLENTLVGPEVTTRQLKFFRLIF